MISSHVCKSYFGNCGKTGYLSNRWNYGPLVDRPLVYKHETNGRPGNLSLPFFSIDQNRSCNEASDRSLRAPPHRPPPARRPRRHGRGGDRRPARRLPVLRRSHAARRPLHEVPPRHPRRRPRQRGEGEGGDHLQLQERRQRVLGQGHALRARGHQEATAGEPGAAERHLASHEQQLRRHQLIKAHGRFPRASEDGMMM